MSKRNIAFVVFACWAAAFAVGAVACHTVEGAGKDVQSAGEAVSDAAHDANK
jgi:predicted small secreted protein